MCSRAALFTWTSGLFNWKLNHSPLPKRKTINCILWVCGRERDTFTLAFTAAAAAAAAADLSSGLISDHCVYWGHTEKAVMFKSYELTLVTDTLYNCVNGLETSRVKHNHSPGQKTKSQSTLRANRYNRECCHQKYWRDCNDFYLNKIHIHCHAYLIHVDNLTTAFNQSCKHKYRPGKLFCDLTSIRFFLKQPHEC